MKLKVKWKNVLFLVLIFIFSISFIFSSYKIIRWAIDSRNTNKEISDVYEQTNINETSDSDKTELIGDEVPKENPYWDYIKMNLIEVDFNELKVINSDTKGWIQVGGTNINYPFVQTKDNVYYLTRSFHKKYTDAGWVFLDYRNKLDGTDKNTIIYAHSRKDKTMFGSLRNILKSGWLNNKNNYVIKLSTEFENTLWQVFSVYHIPTTNDYIKTIFQSDEEFLEFATLIKNRSAYNFNTNINKQDHVLTLSTCYNDTDKVVLHAKLIKKEIR